MRLIIKQANSLNHKNVFSLRNTRVALVFLLAIALAASLSAGLFWQISTLAGTRVAGTGNDGFADNLSLILASPTNCSPLPSGALGWWKAEGNANDVLSGNNGGLQNGTTFSTGLVGQAFSFDGVDDYVSINRSIQDDFTIEFWLNTTQVVGTDSGQWYEGMGLVDAEVRTVTNDFGVTLRNGKVLFGVGNPDVTIRSGFVADGNWHHVAATRQRSTGQMKLYIDGLQVGSATGGTQSLTAPPRITFGRVQVDNNPFQGKLDEVAIYGRVLSIQEIQAIHDADTAGKCTPVPSCAPPSANLVAWWRGEGNANDSVGGLNGTLQNGATFAPGKVGQAFSLDGVNDYVNVSASTSLNVGAGNGLTIDAWINPADISAQHPLVEWNNSVGSWGVHLWISVTCCVPSAVGPGNLYANIIDSNGGFHVISSAPNLITTNAYQHVAVTYEKTSGIATLYLNGSTVAQQNLGVFTPQTTYDMQMGVRRSGGGNGTPYKGTIDEVELFNRALTASEIQSIYSAGSAGRCGPGTIQSLTLSPNPVNGGQSSTGTVTLISAAPAGGVVVNLSSDNPGVATVPSTLTIAEGQTTGTFQIATFVPTSDSSALITASYQTSSAPATLTVLAPKPDLTVSAASVPASVQTDSAFNLSWTVRNQGLARADAPWTDRVFLSNDNQLGNDTLIGEFPFNSNLDPNQTADRIQTFTIARNAISHDGSYFLLIQTDTNNQINEGSNENNNFVARPINITRPPRPDLVVENIVAPNTAFFGQTILVQWAVKNIGGGPTNAPAWQDFVYLSLDDVPEIEDPFKIPVTNVSYLSAGENYTATAEVKIPQGLVGQYKLIVWTDGDGTNHRSNSYPHQVIEDDDENNYGIARPIQINTPTLPDLQTISVVAPEEVFAGAQMTLNWRVENHGDGVTPPEQTNWLDKVYLSQDTTLDVNTDRLVGSRPRSGALTQNEGYTVSNFNLALPNDIAGDWFVFILADGDNQVYEFNNENNNSNYDRQQPGSPMHIRATPPDLVIATSLTAPATASNGQSLSISWTVKNQGAFEAAPNWFDAVYLSADQTLDTESDTRLTSFFRNSPLGPGLTYDVTANVIVPSCISGSYYLFVLTDNRQQIFEFDPNLNAEANNSSQPRPIQIVDSTPDLRVTAVGNPAAGNAGQQISVNWTVANQGTGATAQTRWTDRIYLSPTQTLESATALLIASFDRTVALSNGESYARTENLTIPNTAQGNYFVIVVTDANNEVEECTGNLNNTGVGSQSIAISNTLPDLVVQNASSSSNPVGGQTISVDWTVINQGAVAVNNPSWGDAVYFSSDAALGNDDLRLATAPATGPLATGATYNRQVQATLPIVPPGNYFLIIQADYLGNVFEGQREDNNLCNVALTIQVPAVDLTVSTVDAPSTAFSGQDMTVSWTVLNNGSNPTIGARWVDEVVLSLDQIDDPSDRVVGSKQHNGVLNGQTSYNDVLSVFVPQGFTGQYYVFVRTDRRNEVAESSENNNSALDGTIFNLTPPSDLVVSSIAPPSSGSPGEPITVNWTIQNGGANPAIGLWNDAVYLSSDQTWDIGDILLGKQTQGGPIAAGQSYNGQLTTTLPAINLGNYYVIVRSDVQNRVRETNDDNNTMSANTQTPVDVTELQIGIPRSTTLLTGQERFYKTNAPANETVRFALEGQAGSANELFARFGQIASRNSFDFSFGRLNEANQEVIVPNSQAGNYFTLARSEFSTPSPQNVTVKAEVIPFGITSVSSNRIGDNGQVTIRLKGAKFADGATVKLVRGATVLNSVKEIFVDATTFKARFLLTNAPHGTYDVVLTNPNSQSTVAIQAVTIETATEPTIEMGGSRDTAFPRLGRSTRWTGTLRNSGNVDIQYLKFGVNTESDLDVVMLQTQESLPNQNYLPDGENRMRVSFFRDVAPNEERTVGYSIEGYDSEFEVSIGYSIQTKTEFLLQSQTESELLRLRMLNNPNLPPVLANSVNSPAAWWQTFKLFYTNLGLIDEDTQLNINAVKKAKEILLRKEKLDKISIVQNESCNGISDSLFESCYVEASNDYLDELIKIFQDYFTDILSCRLSIEAPLCIAIAERDLTIKLSVNLAVYAARLTRCGYEYQQRNCRCESEDNEELGCGFTRSACFPFVRFKYCPVFPIDPNEKIGPSGFGSQAFVGTQSMMPYTINFENVSTATAHAQRIRITDQLDPNLDWRTLRLGEIGFKQYRFQVPENRAFFQQRVQLGPDLGNLLADISAGVDLSTGTVTWTLTAIDPATGEQPIGTNAGLLPPNNDSNDGQGFVTFTIKPKSTVATSVVIHNEATITFDTEAPINTNMVSNTIDADAPSSAVDSLPATQPSPTFNIYWSGQDAPNGSGLLSYDIFYSSNNGPYQPLLSGTTATSAQFTGEQNSTYRFYSIARDNAGNVESPPATPDAVTTIGAEPNAVPMLASLSPNSTAAGSPGFTLNIYGNNFINTSTVLWNGAPRTTTFVSATELRATITADDVDAEGTASVTVVNPAPGGGSSNSLTFTINSSPPVTPPVCPTNVAAASYGATASASSEIGANYPASGVIDGNHTGSNWGSGTGWNDATAGQYPDYVEVNLGVTQAISEVDVYSLQDNYTNPAEPTDTMAFTSYGLTNFQVQVPDGVGGWTNVEGGLVTNNNLVKRKFIFTTPVSTDRIRVLVNNSADGVYSRVIEVEAYSCNAQPVPTPTPTPTPEVCATNVALTSYGATVTASSEAGTGYAASGVINGDRAGNNWGSGGGWNDQTATTFPDDLVINLGVAQSVNEIDVYTLQDNYQSPSEPSDSMTFSSYGITQFHVQVPNGSGGWMDVAFVTNNNHVKRRFVFSTPISTDRIRVLVDGSADGVYSRVTEVEVLSCNPVPVPTPSPTPTPTPCMTNVAAASYGATATASSEITPNYSASGVIDGNHTGAGWGTGVGWNDATAGVYPDSLEINLGITQQLSEIDVYSLQDSYQSPVEPTDTLTFNYYGLTDFQVQVPDGAGGWTDVEGGLVSNNNLVKRRFVFTTPVSTDRIRVLINNSADGVYSRVVEIEAFSCNPQVVMRPGRTRVSALLWQEQPPLWLSRLLLPVRD